MRITIADNIKMTGIKNNLNEKICPINILIFSGLFFSLATSLVAIKGNPNSIINKIKMPNVLSDGLVEYADGTKSTVEQMSKDISVFLTWAAEPSLEDRKRLGIKALLFLIVLFILTYISKERIWRDVKH